MKKALSVIVIIFINVITVIPTFAQLNGVEVTTSFPVADTKAVDGDILIMSNQGLVRTTSEYDQKLFGVLQKQAVVDYRKIDNPGLPIARTGIALINVTTINGSIYAGDYITSSVIAGKGEKATRPGFVIGTAISSLEAGKGAQIDYQGKKVSSGQVAVALRIEYHDIIQGSQAVSRLLGPFGSALFSNIQNPDTFRQMVKYVSAGAAFFASILIGFITFSRSLTKSVEAIGRNPLAKNSIYLTIIFNIVFTLALAVMGIIAAIVIIRV